MKRKIIQLDLKSFVKRITTSKNLIYVKIRHGKISKDNVKIMIDNYGGCRISRIRERNKITNALGFKECSGTHFMSCGDENGGTFLANILSHYGPNEYFMENGDILSFETDIKIKGEDYLDFDGKKHFTEV